MDRDYNSWKVGRSIYPKAFGGVLSCGKCTVTAFYWC